MRLNPSTAARLNGQGPTRRLQVPLLLDVPGLAHAFTVKGSETEAVLRESAGPGVEVRTLRQMHGAGVVVAGATPDGVIPGAPAAAQEPPPQGDVLVTSRQGIALAVRVADCVPILACDPRTRALAAVHAGWRGTVARVLEAAIVAMRDSFGTRPADLRLAIGPAIGSCCFEVGDEVVERLLGADPGAGECVLPGARQRVDLLAANRRQALQAGVRAENLAAVGLCTVCHPDLLESFRRDRTAAGRMEALIAWTC
ncbi:MAG TPA: peptidoglycan editing factor PgeF [Candidatus Polarisedimenticolia bacterium]|nr:peptidoglycan editing factor PgeF [Candidatus Polarisedimenticolia bacterium]